MKQNMNIFKVLGMGLVATLLSATSFAAPKVLDCTNTSTVFVNETLGKGGFGIIRTFPEQGISLHDFVYDRNEEKAWAKVIADGKEVQLPADCKQKVDFGVLCQFDVTPFQGVVYRLNAFVKDVDLANDGVEVIMGLDDKPFHMYSPTEFRSDSIMDNTNYQNCVSKDVLEQG